LEWPEDVLNALKPPAPATGAIQSAQEDLKYLKNEYNILNKEISAIGENKQLLKLKHFLVQNVEIITPELKLLEEVDKSVEDDVAYFGESEIKDPATFFSKWEKFANAFKAAVKDNRAQPKKHFEKTKGETTKRTKRKKEEGEPKRPLTAFMLFTQDKRAKVKEDHPNASFSEMGKLLGKEWKNAKPEEKKKFQAKADEEKKKYAIRKEQFEKEKSLKKEDKDDSDDEKDEKVAAVEKVSLVEKNSKNSKNLKNDKNDKNDKKVPDDDDDDDDDDDEGDEDGEEDSD